MQKSETKDFFYSPSSFFSCLGGGAAIKTCCCVFTTFVKCCHEFTVTGDTDRAVDMSEKANKYQHNITELFQKDGRKNRQFSLKYTG